VPQRLPVRGTCATKASLTSRLPSVLPCQSISCVAHSFLSICNWGNGENGTKDGLYPGFKFPRYVPGHVLARPLIVSLVSRSVPGHEIVGRIVKAGKNVKVQHSAPKPAPLGARHHPPGANFRENFPDFLWGSVSPWATAWAAAGTVATASSATTASRAISSSAPPATTCVATDLVAAFCCAVRFGVRAHVWLSCLPCYRGSEVVLTTAAPASSRDRFCNASANPLLSSFSRMMLATKACF
jgi:hypothetical protein